jgi:hypothetical protein
MRYGALLKDVYVNKETAKNENFMIIKLGH